MSANIHPPYNPQILPVRAEQLAKEITQIAESNTDGDVLREQLRFLNNVNWVTNLSDAVLVQVIAESIPETSLTVEEIYRVESWNELVELVFDEYMDDPARDLFQQIAIDSQLYQFEIPNDDMFEPAVTMDEDDSFPKNELSYTTYTLEYKRYDSQTELGSPYRSLTINGLAEEFANHVIGDLVELLPDPTRTDNPESVEDQLIDAMVDLKDDGYHPDRAVVGEDVSLPQFNGVEKNTIYGMEIKESAHPRPNAVIIADTERLGYEGVWERGKAVTNDPWNRHRDSEIEFQPIQVGYKQTTNGIVLDEDAVKHIAV